MYLFYTVFGACCQRPDKGGFEIGICGIILILGVGPVNFLRPPLACVDSAVTCAVTDQGQYTPILPPHRGPVLLRQPALPGHTPQEPHHPSSESRQSCSHVDSAPAAEVQKALLSLVRKKPLCIGEVLGTQARPCRCLSGLVQAGLTSGLWLVRQRERLLCANSVIILWNRAARPCCWRALTSGTV